MLCLLRYVFSKHMDTYFSDDNSSPKENWPQLSYKVD